MSLMAVSLFQQSMLKAIQSNIYLLFSLVKLESMGILTMILYSAGLAPTGDPDGDCSSSTGQVYARAETYGDYYAIMYSWFMPKDEPSLLESLFGVGHRYDWENVVIVLTSESTDATLVGMAASYHGDYNVCSGSDCDDYLDGNNPLIKYYSAYEILDHSLGFTTTVGGTEPLIAWDELPTVSQDGLTDKDWGGK